MKQSDSCPCCHLFAYHGLTGCFVEGCACKGKSGPEMGYVRFSKKEKSELKEGLINKLDKLRRMFRKPIRIKSGLRSCNRKNK